MLFSSYAAAPPGLAAVWPLRGRRFAAAALLRCSPAAAPGQARPASPLSAALLTVRAGAAPSPPPPCPALLACVPRRRGNAPRAGPAVLAAKPLRTSSGRQRAGRVRGVLTPRTTRPALSGGRLRAASLSAPARCPPARRPSPAGRQIARAQRKSKGFTSGCAALAFPWAACRFAAALWLAPLRRAWVVLAVARSGPRLRPPLPAAAPGAPCAVPARLPVAASKVRSRSPWRLRRRKRRLAVPGPLAGGGAGALQAAPFASAAPAPGGGGGDRPPLPRLPAFIRRRGGAAPDRREFPGGRGGNQRCKRWPPSPTGLLFRGRTLSQTNSDHDRSSSLVQSRQAGLSACGQGHAPRL